MPRLLILCEHPTVLGGERSMLATVPTVCDNGFEVIVAAPPEGPLTAELNRLGIAHAPWQTRFLDQPRPPLTRLRGELADIVHESRVMLVHANSLSMARVAGPVAARLGVPSIGHLRDIAKLSRPAVQDLNEHSRLIAVSQATRDFHVAQGLATNKTVVLYNGVDLQEFRPRSPTGYLHRELALSADAQLIAVIGQLGLRKGTEVALAAASHVAECFPRVHWLIVGERTSSKLESREFEAHLHKLANLPDIAGRISFLGSRTDIPQLLNECQLLVHAARQEPLGRVLLEAAASGLPVVANAVGGTPEIFPPDSNTAILVPPDDPGAIAGAVRSLLLDQHQRQVIATNARRRAEESFDLRVAARQLLSVYQHALP